MRKLKKGSPIPLYIQLKEHILARVERGELKPGQRLPSERELCDQFAVSRITVRQALAELMRDGLLQSVPGKGTFVARKREDEFHPLASFSQQVRTQSQSPSSHVLNRSAIRASERLARQLQVPIHSKVALIERLRLADGEARALQTAYIPLELCPDLLKHDFEKESLYQVLQTVYGLTPVRADHWFEARLADPNEERLLHLAHLSAVLVMRQTSYLQDGRPIEYTRSIYRANERFHSVFGSRASDVDEP